MTRLAIFDLDDTLLHGDSDHAWGEFIIEQGLVDAEWYRTTNDNFYRDYQQGTLDIIAYQRFVLQALLPIDNTRLFALREQFVREKIQAMWCQQSLELMYQHQREGDTLIIITATNAFITEPIAALTPAVALLATLPEYQHGKLTGDITGIPSYRDGKILRLIEWINGRDMPLDQAYFYSDSFNDLPLLNEVGSPHAVNPDDRLRTFAKEQGWPVLDFAPST
jgi:hypothetical protein